MQVSKRQATKPGIKESKKMNQKATEDKNSWVEMMSKCRTGKQKQEMHSWHQREGTMKGELTKISGKNSGLNTQDW